MEREVSLTEQAGVAREFLAGLVGAFGAEGAVEVREVDEETVELAVRGGDLGLLIGPRGVTLGAIQEVTRTVVQRRTGGRHGRILVDVGGYREKRRMALGRFAREIAAEVKATGVRKALEPMSAADRKVVHDTVNEIEGVSTTSEGEDPARRVVIEPS
jgi:spoIIIJ-associated protein